MQAYSVLIWVIVLTIGASETVPRSPNNKLIEWLNTVSQNADQKEVLINAAAKAIETSVHGFLDRTRALCDEIIASGHNDAENGLKQGRSNSSGEPIDDTVRRILREGLDSKNVPPLDPYTYQSLPPLDVNIEDVLRIKLQLDQGSFSGLANFEDDVKYTPKLTLPIRVNVTFDVLEPVLQFITGYNLDAITTDLDIWGIGNLTFKLFSLRVKGAVTVRTKLLPTLIEVNPCDINVTGRNSKVELTGLFGGGVTSQLVGEIFTDLVNENLDTVLSAVSQLVEKEVCAYLRAKSLTDWLKLLQYLRKITMMPMPPST